MNRALLLLIFVLTPTVAHAAPRVRLRDGFPIWELVGIGALGATDVVLGSYEYEWGRDHPLIGDPWKFDRRVSDAAYRGPNAPPFAGNAPELILTELVPSLYLGLTALDSTFLWWRGRSLSGASNTDHHLFAFLEGLLASDVLAYGTKLSVGRERPYEALHRFHSDPGEKKTLLAFYSKQTSTAFVVSTFLYFDLSTWLVNNPLANKAWATRLLVGRLLPGVVLFGAAALDGFSRVIEQRHYMTDVLVGAAAGAGLGWLAYARHFDAKGQPRNFNVNVAPTAGGVRVSGRF